MDFSAVDQWFETLNFGDEAYRGMFQIFAVVLLTAILSFVSGKFFSQLEKQLNKTRNLWDDTLLHAGRKPASYMIWLLGLSIAAHTANRYSGSEIFSIVGPIREVGVIALLCWFIVRFISGAEKIVVSPEKMKEPMDLTTVSAMGKLLRASVLITAGLIVLQTLGYSVSGVLAFGGIGGIAVGFAAKDLLANFFGGLMVYLDRPFKVGDWVRSPDKEIEGTVEHIGWRLTTIRTFDKRPLYVPNATFTSISVQNPSRMSHRRIYETIGVRYQDGASVNKIIAKVKDMLIAHDEIASDQTLIVNFDAFGASSLNFFIYTFTKTTNWIKFHEVKQDVLMKIMAIIEEEGAEFAFPTTTVHLPDDLKITSSSPEFAGISANEK
ncbi:mechanosensitive ion channel family protein [Alkalimarinus alittae]|uniref:Mechanosensitive ion channel family protein n=1 Tax=Alkalimarinus alittae TaxID=2961619 RepID=A0ABY6MY90_9ALTE|nr:mechanosensitive ion channel family protein [Alkalimarinus alittae]UZE94744.1 mechanosensitive ion channel family protein [Alkalimarinus alittae]